MKRALIMLLAVGLLVAPQALAAKPPSFALWTVRESNHEASLTNPVTEGCKKVAGNDDKRAGECVVAGLLKVFPAMESYWERGVGRVAKGQAPGCKRAIHAYWLAARKNFTARVLYLKANRHTAATQIQSDITGEPYATLALVKDEAKSHAIRVCG